MNIVRIPRLLKNSTLLLTILGSSFLLTACGGGGSDKSNNSSSLSSSSSNSHAFSSTPVTTPGSGTWPDVKVSASGTKTLKFDWTPVSGATYYKILKKADSTSSFVQVGSDFTATTTVDPVSVHLTDWVNSRYKVQACDNSGCQDSSVIVADSAMISAVTYVKASNTEANDWFGWSVAISGDGKTMAVGATAESSNAVGVNGDQASNTSPTSGAVYVFAKVNGNWQQEAYLKASNNEQPSDGSTSLPIPNGNARFGYQVALSTDGNTLAVSAINEDSVSVSVNCDPHNINYSSSTSNSQGFVTNSVNTDIGAVYMFKRTNAQWTQDAYIKPFLAYFYNNSNIAFGYSLALSGDGKTLAVGTAVDKTFTSGIVNFIADSSSSAVGRACINFSSLSSTNSNSSSSISSSTSSSSSSSSANSSSSSSIPGGANSGAVYIYKLKESGWIEDAYIKASDAGTDDFFGTSIALSNDGNSMVVGAPGEDSKDTSANDDIITIDTFNAWLDNGGVYVFARGAEKWTQEAKLKPSYIQWKQEFGASVALSADGSTLAVGTPGDWTATGGINPNGANYDPKVITNYASGAAYLFTKSGTTWAQQAYLKPAVVNPGYQFGSTVSLSANGNILAVGSWLDSSQATGINGDQLDSSAASAGAAYVFSRAGTTWSQKSYVKAPNTDKQDRFGRSLELDDSGESLVIGAHKESSKAVGVNGSEADNSAASAGAAYVF
ncbi:MAG: hypothetical protein EOO68_03405 [Moraxellaceae bacterium]|nr:MAG: hypothetical protein EOO68_03405 [Moraxellaceae bacterium]